MDKTGINRKEVLELIDLLRRNVLYQTPKPTGKYVTVRLLLHHYQRIIRLVAKAGGWVLSKRDIQALLHEHEKAAQDAYSNYDFSHLNYGDLVNMYTELEGIEDLSGFRAAVKGAMEAND